MKRTHAYMPCRRHVGVAAVAGCRDCQAAPPPGETGRELTGGHLLDVLADQFRDMTETPQIALPTKALAVRRLGRWVVVTVMFQQPRVLNGREVNEVTVRVSRTHAETLWQQLGQALER